MPCYSQLGYFERSNGYLDTIRELQFIFEYTISQRLVLGLLPAVLSIQRTQVL